MLLKMKTLSQIRTYINGIKFERYTSFDKKNGEKVNFLRLTD